jgi:hypothetical protein
MSDDKNGWWDTEDDLLENGVPASPVQTIVMPNYMGFCDMFDVGRFDRPFTESGYDFYTDGHIVVRVTATGKIDRGNPIDGSLMQYFDKDPVGDPEQLSDIAIPLIGCWTCRGTGRTTVCKECAGEGEVTFDTKYNSYEFGCKSCDGEGVLPGGIDICQHCAGSGQIVDDTVKNDVEVFGARFNIKLISKVLSLPGIKMYPDHIKPRMYKFIFDGGDGLLMASPA